MKCPSCGSDNPADSAFCNHCGKSLEAAYKPAPGETTAGLVDPRFGLRSGKPGADLIENELWAGGYSAKAMYGAFVIAGLATIGLLVGMFFAMHYWWIFLIGVAVVWLYVAGLYFVRKLSVNYRLTNQRLTHRHGLLSRVIDRIETFDMDDVSVVQGPIERMLGVGTIVITSSDMSHPKLELIGIDNVEKVAALADDARRAERLRRKVHIETN